METAQSRSWWAYLLEGVITVIFGVAVLAWPGITLFAFILLFGAIAVANGLSQVMGAFANWRRPGWLLLITGIFSIAAGIVAFAWPAATGLVLLLIIGAYALVAGIAAIVGVIGSWRTARGKWVALLRGIVGIVFGIMAFTWPGATALSLAWLIGIYAVGYGISGIIFSIMSRGAKE